MRRPFYRKQTGAWYGWIGGKQIRLLKGPKTAETKREAEELFISQSAGIETVAVKGLTVREVIGQFLEFAEVENSHRTYRWYLRHCGSFGKFVGNLRVCDLKPIHVTRWSQRQKAAGHKDNTRAGAIRGVMRCFNWAEKQGLIDRNPVRRVERPKYVPRDVRITDDQWSALLAALKPDDPFKTFLNALRETGARPREVRMIEARHLVGRSWVFEVLESKGKKRRRAVPLNDSALAITQELAAKNPTGPLFRNRRGTPWTTYSINNRLCALAESTGVKITAYAVRHEFISKAIERGVDPVTLAKIAGHVDTVMLSRVYSHHEVNGDHIQRAVKIATGEAV